jgi:predicted MPP superfamily phosphohydrolase
MQRYVAAANSMGVDLMAVTGDFVNSDLNEVYPFAEAFVDLKGKDGVYGVLGNHDFYTRQVDDVAKEVNQCGIRLLRGEGVRIERNGEYFDFMGVDDVGFPVKAGEFFDQALIGTVAGVPKIMMCHRPYFFQQAEERNIDLVLSGHTHGGQIVFGQVGMNILAPARLASPYVAGLYKRNASQMYVSRGIGTVGIPIRINCSPEITKITLVRA